MRPFVAGRHEVTLTHISTAASLAFLSAKFEALTKEHAAALQVAAENMQQFAVTEAQLAAVKSSAAQAALEAQAAVDAAKNVRQPITELPKKQEQQHQQQQQQQQQQIAVAQDAANGAVSPEDVKAAAAAAMAEPDSASQPVVPTKRPELPAVPPEQFKLPAESLVAVKPVDVCADKVLHVTFAVSGLFEQVMTAMGSIIATTATPHLVFFHLVTDAAILNDLVAYYYYNLFFPSAAHPDGGGVDDAQVKAAKTPEQVAALATTLLRAAFTTYMVRRKSDARFRGANRTRVHHIPHTDAGHPQRASVRFRHTRRRAHYPHAAGSAPGQPAQLRAQLAAGHFARLR